MIFIITFGWTCGDSDINLTLIQYAYYLWCCQTGSPVPLPPYLLVQVDGGEWTQYLFYYYAWLIQSNKTVQVVLSKLPVGHTHNDQDSRFGAIAHMLMGRGRRQPGVDMHSPNHLVELILKCFEGADMLVRVEQWWVVFGFKKWLEPYMTSNFGGHKSKPAGEGASMNDKADAQDACAHQIR